MALKTDFLKTWKSKYKKYITLKEKQYINDRYINDSIIKNYSDIFELIDKGVDMNHQNSESKETLLHIAVWKGQSSSVERLISLGAKIDIQDKSGNTPLHLAIIKQDVEMVKLLIKAGGIDINLIKNQNGSTPLKIAENKGYKEIALIISLLLFRTQDISNVNKELYENFINKFEQLEKSDYTFFVKNSISNEFKKGIDNLKKIEKELDNLVIERKTLENSINNKTWLNIITLGFYKKKISKKILKNLDTKFEKNKELNSEQGKMKDSIQEVENMINDKIKLQTENKRLMEAEQALKIQLENKEKTLQHMNQLYEKIKLVLESNNKKISELENVLQQNKTRIEELNLENGEYKKVQERHNEKFVTKFQDLKTKIRGQEEEIAFYKEEKTRLEKELNKLKSDDSGIETNNKVDSFDANIINKSEQSTRYAKFKSKFQPA